MFCGLLWLMPSSLMSISLNYKKSVLEITKWINSDWCCSQHIIQRFVLSRTDLGICFVRIGSPRSIVCIYFYKHESWSSLWRTVVTDLNPDKNITVFSMPNAFIFTWLRLVLYMNIYFSNQRKAENSISKHYVLAEWNYKSTTNSIMPRWYITQYTVLV